MAEQDSKEGFKVKFLADEGGVEVNGKWYSSLPSYFEKREADLKEKSDHSEKSEKENSRSDVNF